MAAIGVPPVHFPTLNQRSVFPAFPLYISGTILLTCPLDILLNEDYKLSAEVPCSQFTILIDHGVWRGFSATIYAKAISVGKRKLQKYLVRDMPSLCLMAPR